MRVCINFRLAEIGQSNHTKNLRLIYYLKSRPHPNLVSCAKSEGSNQRQKQQTVDNEIVAQMTDLSNIMVQLILPVSFWLSYCYGMITKQIVGPLHRFSGRDR